MFNGMKITRANADGRMPWSQTVVNVERAKKKRGKRATVMALIICLVLCGACSGCWMMTRKPQATSAKSQSAATPTRTFSIQTPEPGWTPVSGNPLVQYRLEPLKK